MRRFEFSEGASNKFWEAETKGKDLLIRFGKLGSPGQLKLKTLASPVAAHAELDRVIAEKVKKGYVEIGGDPIAKQPPPSGVKPTQLVIESLSVAGSTSPRTTTLVDDEHGHAAVGAGNRMFASSDGKHFYRATNPNHESWDLFTFGNAVYSTGTELLVTRDVGATWKKIEVPSANNFQNYYTLLRDSKGTYWIGSDDGVVLTSDHLDRGWKKAKFKAPGKVLSMAEIDGKLFIVGVGCITWDGKKTSPLKGTSNKETICRITEAPNGGIVLLGNDGVSYHSSDRGKSFKKTKSGYELGDDLEDCAWVAGALFVVGGGWTSPLVLRSDDQGKTFKKVPFSANRKLWGITSWGDGAFLSGDPGVYALAAPNDPYWNGTTDRLKPAEARPR